MDHKLGHVIPSNHEIETVIQDLAAIRMRIARFVVTLTTEERKRTTKFRPGGEEIVERLERIAKEVGVTALPKITVEDMHRDLELVRRLRPLQQAVDELQRQVSDTV